MERFGGVMKALGIVLGVLAASAVVGMPCNAVWGIVQGDESGALYLAPMVGGPLVVLAGLGLWAFLSKRGESKESLAIRQPAP